MDFNIFRKIYYLCSVQKHAHGMLSQQNIKLALDIAAGLCYTYDRGPDTGSGPGEIRRYSMTHIINQESVRVQITRGTLCDILIAITAVQQARRSRG